MCTGDNILTGLSVARDCGMINEKQKIILVDAESGQEPKFSYADIKRQNKFKSEKSEINIEEVI
jgi:magnesium-transporting ATPase (P-type)